MDGKNTWGGYYLDYLRSIGCTIGEGTELFSHPINCFIDPSRPYLINIGKNVKITRGVVILTHGYDWSTINGKYGDVLGSSGKIVIGDNCFIGMNSTILKGVTIGNNVIIGANSLVNKDFPSDCVVAGNPAKLICTLDEYRNKRVLMQLEEATELAREYKNKTGHLPTKQTLDEFRWLFEERNDQNASRAKNRSELTYKQFLNTEPLFDGFDKFLEYVFKED